MRLEERLLRLRKQKGLSQEELAERLGISRQTVSKWENGQAVPELSGLIGLSGLYGVSIDRIVKEDGNCGVSWDLNDGVGETELVGFLIAAKKNTYAGKGKEVEASRTGSHDFRYEGENGYVYYDTYLGGERFVGEEAVWVRKRPVWSMNYAGRALGEAFDGDFLKEALRAVTETLPYRGPAVFTKGEYHYHCKVEGDFSWFRGYEDIFYGNERCYECFFHGGLIR